MVEYSARARTGYVFLYGSYNDIDIYVEDTANRAAYEILIGRLLGNRGRITRVHQFGGKAAVIEECKRLRHDRSRKRLFIVDGDLELIYGIRPARYRDLHILDAYCFENLIISTHAVYEVARESDVNSPSIALAASIGIDALIDDAKRYFLPLFVAYSIAHFGGCGCSTVGLSVYQLMTEPKDGEISAQKVRERFSGILRYIWDKLGRVRYLCLKRQIYAGISNRRLPPERYISGKDYLLPLFHHRLQRRANFRGSRAQMLAQLARHCELRVWYSFRQKIVRRTS